MPEHIDPEKVKAVFLDCLFRPEEIIGEKIPEGAVIVEGIIHTMRFHPERLNSHKETIKGWLSLLPLPFRKDAGGGWSFLNACYEESGFQWTGLHLRMEELFTLGIGLGLASWVAPRDMWSILPGSMPYVQITV